MSILYKNDIKRILPLLQKMAEGKILQIKTMNGWIDVDADKDGVNIDYLLNNGINIRIKKEPKFRPFKGAEECWNEMQKHQPFAWVKEKHSDRYSLITEVNGLSIKVKEGCLFTDGVKYYTFADGTPFGVKVEE